MDDLFERSTTDHRQKVEERIDGLMQMAVVLHMPIQRPRIDYDLFGVAAGYAKVRNGIPIIRVNERLLIDNLDDYLFNTIGHEFAHLMVDVHYPRAKGHGYEWRMVMLRLGLEPKRTHNYDTSRTRVKKISKMTVYCGCEAASMSVIQYNKMVLKGVKYRCRKCGQRVTKEKI